MRTILITYVAHGRPWAGPIFGRKTMGGPGLGSTAHGLTFLGPAQPSPAVAKRFQYKAIRNRV